MRPLFMAWVWEYELHADMLIVWESLLFGFLKRQTEFVVFNRFFSSLRRWHFVYLILCIKIFPKKVNITWALFFIILNQEIIAHFFTAEQTIEWHYLILLWCYPYLGHYLQQELCCFISCNLKYRCFLCSFKGLVDNIK